MTIVHDCLYSVGVPTLTNILNRAENLTNPDREWLHQLVGDWQVISDVSFADLLLLAPGVNDDFVYAALCRPATAATLFHDDMVGKNCDPSLVDAVKQVFDDGKSRERELRNLVVTLHGVRRNGKVVAAMAVVKAFEPDRVPSQIQGNYEQVSAALIHMVTTGEFPFDNVPTGVRHGTPRLTDGFVQIDEDGTILYASPNAVSSLHRLGYSGSIHEQTLAELVTSVIEDHACVDETLAVVVMGRAPWLTELETRGVVLSMRAVPLLDEGERLGAIVMVRDITELRRREQELVTKDATIREINHRVKNNLQTVSALLRMQARRADDDVTRQSLETAQRRISTIAVVHQTLSQALDETVDFNEVFAPILRMASDIATTGAHVCTRLSGEFGQIGANQATALAVVLNELVTNAVEHGVAQGGHLDVTAERNGRHLSVEIADDGAGLQGKKPGSGLGTSIVKTMVAGELHGSIGWRDREGGGTLVHLDAEID